MGAADLTQTTVESSDGRTLTGVGVSAEQLEATIDRHEPDVTESAPVPAVAASEAASSQLPKPTRGQARFSELTQKAKDAEAKAEAAERKAAELEARLAHPPQPRQEPAARQEPQPPAQPQFTRPEPSEDEVGTKYETYAAFTRDQAQWVWEQQQGSLEQRIRAGIEADRAQQAYTAHVESIRTKGRAAYRDFDAMLQGGPGTFVDMPLSAVQAIFQHPQSEHLQYQIMKDGALAQKLAGLAFRDPFAFAFELARLAPASAVASSASTATALPVVPAPMQPVGSGSATTVTPSADHAKRGDYQAYKAARAAERGVTRRR